MPFVVRVAGTGFNIAWLGSDPSDGSCVFRVAPRRTCLSDTSGRDRRVRQGNQSIRADGHGVLSRGRGLIKEACQSPQLLE
jgi:hypothetical protein